MRQIAAVVVVLACTDPASAADDALFRAKAEMLEMACEAEGRLARSIMRSRQIGVPISRVTDGMDLDRHREIAARAYDLPRMQTDDAREQATWAFGDEAEIACYRRRAAE